MLGRRGLFGLGAALAAPALIRTPGLLMPVRPLVAPAYSLFELPLGAPVGTCLFVTQETDLPVLIRAPAGQYAGSAIGTARTRAKHSRAMAWKVDGRGWALSGDLAG